MDTPIHDMRTHKRAIEGLVAAAKQDGRPDVLAFAREIANVNRVPFDDTPECRLAESILHDLRGRHTLKHYLDPNMEDHYVGVETVAEMRGDFEALARVMATELRSEFFEFLRDANEVGCEFDPNSRDYIKWRDRRSK